MTSTGDWIPSEEWETVVRNVPIVSVDLVVESPARVVLGRRTNEPAQGAWFVPGGRLRKGESLRDAVDRIARQELGTSVEVVERLGAYEHRYQTSEVGGPKHYVANAFHVWTEDVEISGDDQHSDLRAFEEPPGNVHEYTAEYLRTIGCLDDEE